MEKFVDWLVTAVTPKLKKLNENCWISGVSSAMFKSVPYILVGSLIFLYNTFRGYLSFLPDLGPIASYSFGLISVVIAFMIGQQCMEKLGHNEYKTTAGIISILILFMAVKEETNPYGRIGPSGMLVAIVTSLFVAVIFHLFAKLQLLEDSSMPDFIIGWFRAIIPSFLILLISQILVINLDLDIYAIILQFFMPIQNFAQTLPGMILLCLIPSMLYCMGVSSWMFTAISSPVYLAAISENIDNVANGLPALNFTTNEAIFASGLIMMGGIGATLALNILMLCSKSKQIRTMGKIFIGTSIFNINEPIVYGAPIVLNPILMVPFCLNAIVGPCLLWAVLSLKWLNIPSALFQATNVPVPVGTVLAFQDWRGVIWAIIFFIVYLVIWYPFFKAYERGKLLEEKQ